jgi:hypothetical protein
MRKWIATATAVALTIATAGPAMAQSYGLAQQFDDEAGASVSFNYRVPLGGGRSLEEPSYGVTLNWGYREALPGYDDGEFRPNLELADLRFNEDGLARTEVASFNLMRDADGEFADPRLNWADPASGDKSKLWIFAGVGLAVLGICLLAECFEDDDEEDHPSISN